MFDLDRTMTKAVGAEKGERTAGAARVPIGILGPDADHAAGQTRMGILAKGYLNQIVKDGGGRSVIARCGGTCDKNMSCGTDREPCRLQ